MSLFCISIILLAQWLQTVYSLNGTDYVDYLGIHDEFPTDIIKTYRRRDHHVDGGYPVVSGLLHKLQGRNKMTYEEFHQLLQCPPSEPALDSRGTLSLLRMVKPTRYTLEVMCGKLELDTGDLERPQNPTWKDYQEFRNRIRENQTAEPDFKPVNGFFLTRYNSKTGKFSYDWPWKIEKFSEDLFGRFKDYQPFAFLSTFLPYISDLKDIFFFTNGVDISSLSYREPFPAFAFSADSKQIDFVIPWPASYLPLFEKQDGLIIQNTQRSYHSGDINSWMQKRISKAVFYCNTITEVRQMVFDMASLRPDLFDVGANHLGNISPWNPLSTENIEDIQLNYNTTPGYLGNIQKFVGKSSDFTTKRYKYSVVLLGKDGKASADRLPLLLAHSGTVVLLQASHEFEYHFSPRLKPWVHYVPISYNTVDIIRKVEWLNANPKLAYQIAVNAKLFGDSYLRIEDYYCYFATLFKELGDVLAGSDALISFHEKTPITGYE